MLLLRGATLAAGAATSVSIHAPLARSNGRSAARRSSVFRFQHAPLARSNSCDCGERGKQRVSIHAPLARSNAPCADEVEAGAVSIHAPLARSNGTPRLSHPQSSRFQYMLLLRGATSRTSIPLPSNNGFNTCSSCEEQRKRLK